MFINFSILYKLSVSMKKTLRSLYQICLFLKCLEAVFKGAAKFSYYSERLKMLSAIFQAKKQQRSMNVGIYRVLAWEPFGVGKIFL